MKRDNHAITVDNNHTTDQKKIKLTSSSTLSSIHTNNTEKEEEELQLINNNKKYSLSDLPRDEWTVIVPFLPVGTSVLMLALTSKANYEWMNHYIKQVVCKYYVVDHPNKMKHNSIITSERKEWSLGNALRQKERLCIGSSNIGEVREILLDIAKRNGSMEELTKFLVVNYLDYHSLYELLNIRKESGSIQIETLSVNSNGGNLESENIVKTIEKEPVSYSLKGVELRMTLSRTKLLKILTKMKDLDTLVLKIEKEKEVAFDYGTGRGKGRRVPIIDNVIDEKHEAFDENNVFIPICDKLKTLKVQQYLDDENSITEILALFPNLEYLFYGYTYQVVDDNFLETICESCPKLKSLWIYSTDEDDSEKHSEITDEGLLTFLGKQSNIEAISIDSAPCVTGEILKKLGDFPKLKMFSVERVSSDATYEEQDTDIYFGGAPNPNLEYFSIGYGYDFNDEQFANLINSMKTVAPNLKEFGEIGNMNSAERSRKIAELYVTTLETLSISPTLLDIVPLCINLKKVLLDTNLFREDKMGTNLNVTELVDYDIVEIYPMLTESFPNLKFIACYGFSLLSFLLENRNCWPNLSCIKFEYLPEPDMIETLIAQRPNIAIEIVEDNDIKIPISQQVFYHQWMNGKRNKT